MFAVRWGVAVAGIWWVVSNMTFRDQVYVLDARKHPQPMALARDAQDEDSEFRVIGHTEAVPRHRVINRRDRKEVMVSLGGEPARKVTLLGLDLTLDRKQRVPPTVHRLLIADPATGEGVWIPPGQVAGGFTVQVPYPKIERGLLSMTQNAKGWMLVLALLVFPINFIITSLRWHRFLKAVDIHLTAWRAFVLTMVGAFYNAFMLGSTGGDVLKAYYASKHTDHKTRAVVSVIVDRVIGLMALVILGGVMAAFQWMAAPTGTNDAATRACRSVALGAAAIVGGFALFVAMFGIPAVRQRLGLDYLLNKLPFQRQVQHTLWTMSAYRRRPGLVLGALVVSFPVHITVVVSAMLAGMAFEPPLPIPAAYYFVCVPVIVLAGAIPITPQGAGVMEPFAILLTKQFGTSVSQAFALVMSIRLVQIIWNLTGGVFVLRGGYHAPTEAEQEEMEHDDDDTTGAHDNPAPAIKPVVNVNT